MDIRIKKLTETAKVPTRGSKMAAGYDLYADITEDVEIQPGKVGKITSGIAVEIPKGYFGAIYARSGLATREGLRLPNSVGVIDADYRGNIGISLYNDSDEVRTIHPGERIAQLVVQPFMELNFVEADELTDTDRGAGGFGSTGRA